MVNNILVVPQLIVIIAIGIKYMISYLSKMMMRCAIRKITSRILVYISVFLFVLTLGLSNLIPDKATAAVPPEEYRSMEKAAIAVYCLEKYGVHGEVESKQAADGMIFASTIIEGDVREGGLAKVFTSGLVESDNDIGCASNIRTAVTELGLKYDYIEGDDSSFLAKFYTKKESTLALRENMSTADAVNMLKNKIAEKGWDKRPIPYVKAALQPKFNECVTEISETEYNDKDPNHFEFNGKKYGLKGGKGAGDSKTDKKVGVMLDPPDGVWSCGEMMSKLKSGESFAEGKSLVNIMLGDASKEAEKEQNTEAKLKAIRDVLNKDPNITVACSASVDAAFGATSATAQINTISTWLANGATGAMDYSAGRSMSEENAKKIADCLNQNLPDLQAAVDTELDFDGLDGGSANDGPSCESEGGVMSWVICPAIFLGDAVLRKLDQAIHSLLSTPNDYIDNDGLRQAWLSLRNIAYMILVPITLVMVISTALGFEFISAYTVKRALPRMVIAVIFIALSFEITKFLVVLTNNVGVGLEGLLSQSIAGRDDLSLATIFAPSGGDSATALVVGGIVGVGALAIGSIGIILSYLFVAVIGLATGFFLLSLRQMLIVMLMILAPVAILAWIFPGNDKLWKLWWGTFSKLLLLFPLIIILTTSGKVFAAIIAGVTVGEGSDAIDSSFVTTLIKLVAYVGPYFMIPAMFKFAGGIFATVSGMANDKSRGLLDRQKKYRGQKMGQNWKDTKANKRFSGTGAISQFANRNMQRMAHANKIGLRGLVSPATARSRMATATATSSMAAMQEDLEKNLDFAQIKNDDDLLSAGMNGGSEQDVRDFLRRAGRHDGNNNVDERDVAAVMAARRALGNNFNSAAIIAKSGTGTGYAGPDGAGQLTQDIINASRGNRNMENSLYAAAKSQAANARRYDLQGGFSTFLSQKEQLKANTTSIRDASNALTDSALDSQGAGAVLAGRGQSTDNFGAALTRRLQGSYNDLQAAYQSGDADRINTAQREFTQHVASSEALIDVAGQSSPENARSIADRFHSTEIDLASAPADMRNWLAARADGTYTPRGSMTARDLMTHMGARAGNANIPNAREYDEMRRNYANSYQQESAQRAAGAGGPGTGPTVGMGPI